jgi:hypothetical protein
MLGFALRSCKKPILLTAAVVAPFQVVSILTQDFGILPGLFPFINQTIILWGFMPFLILPFYLGVQSQIQFRDVIPIAGARGAWYLGVTAILLPAAISVILALVHFVLALSSGSLTETQGNALAINLIVGFITSLWAGAIFGWLGYLAARMLQLRERDSAG